MRALKNPRQQRCGLLEMMAVRHKKGLLAQLRAAYQRGGMPAFQEVHLAALRQHWEYRTLRRLVDFASPISSLLTLASDFDRRIGEVGLCAAAHAMIETLPLSWGKRLPQKGAEILSTAPLLIYGNHPSMLTPFLIAAAVNRSDLRIIALSYLGKLVPSLEAHLFPLQASQRRTLRGRSRSGMAHALSLSLIYRLDGQLNSKVARDQNQATLSKATQHILGGGAAVIFPEEEERNPAGGFLESVSLLQVWLRPLRQTPSILFLCLFKIAQMHESTVVCFQVTPLPESKRDFSIANQCKSFSRGLFRLRR